MKLLLDQGLPRSAAELLRAAGIDAVHTGEIGCATAEDAEILAREISDIFLRGIRGEAANGKANRSTVANRRAAKKLPPKQKLARKRP